MDMMSDLLRIPDLHSSPYLSCRHVRLRRKAAFLFTFTAWTALSFVADVYLLLRRAGYK